MIIVGMQEVIKVAFWLLQWGLALTKLYKPTIPLKNSNKQTRLSKTNLSYLNVNSSKANSKFEKRNDNKFLKVNVVSVL